MTRKLSAIAQNINRRMLELDIQSIRSLEDKAGVARDTIRNLVSGRTKIIREEKIAPIARALNMAPEELFSYPLMSQKLSVPKISHIDPRAVSGSTDPLEIVGYVELPKEWLETLTSEPNPDMAVVSVNGESMAPALHNGDIAVVNRADRDINKAGLFALVLENSISIKRISASETRITIRSDDQNSVPFSVCPDDITRLYVIGRVIARLGKVA